MAPEIVSRKGYNEKCDIWSCGVIAYMLISGDPPFDGLSRTAIIKSIQEGEADFSGNLSAAVHLHTAIGGIWSSISKEGTDFIKRMLEIDPKKRISAKEALTSAWFRMGQDSNVSFSDIRLSMQKLEHFRTQTQLQKAVLAYFATQQMCQNEEVKLREVFDALDVNKDGQISMQELIEGCFSVCKDMSKAKAEAAKIMAQVDLNKNGSIDYTEFLVANLKINAYLGEEKLKEAFEFYDTVRHIR